MQIYIQAYFTDKIFLIFSHSIPGPERDTPLQMEISLTNVNLLHKRKFSTWFSKIFLGLLFFKLISPK